MKVVAVDPDPRELVRLTGSIRKLYPDASVESFDDPFMAFRYGVLNPVDSLYAAVKMNRLSGFELGQKLREQYPGILLNFISDDTDKKPDALRLNANSYIVRPATAEALRMAEEKR